MIYPSNFDDELVNLRNHLKNVLNKEADRIIKEEIEKILGRVKIITHKNLGNTTYDWFIIPEGEKLK